jgi:CMP-N-acetylneuraminic acid synthetase
VIVSTDDPKIAEVALAAGAEVPFLRPSELSRDETPTFPVIRHLHETLRNDGWSADVVAVLQPTSPFRTADDIRECLTLRDRLEAEAVVSVTESEAHPAWCFGVSDTGILVPFLKAEMPTRRQDLLPAFRPNGALYVVTRKYLEENSTFYGKKTRAFIMPPERSLDIDTPWDLRLARLIVDHATAPN